MASSPVMSSMRRASVKKEFPKQEINYNEEGLSVLEFDNIRQKMAEHMVESVAISPHVNAIAEVDLTNVEKARKKMAAEFEANEGFKLTYMPFIAEAVIKALKDFPLINSIIDDSSKSAEECNLSLWVLNHFLIVFIEVVVFVVFLNSFVKCFLLKNSFVSLHFFAVNFENFSCSGTILISVFSLLLLVSFLSGTF